MSFTWNFVKSPKFPYLLIFMTGVALRGIPELLVSWYPIGYETITWYAPLMMSFYGRDLMGIFQSTFMTGPLFYVLMQLISVASGVHPYIILKAVGPLLYGGLAVSFFLFLKYGVRLNEKMAFVAALILVFQVATLRISWDRFKNVLGLIFLFATLTALKSDHKYKWPLVVIFAALTVLSREYISFVLFVSVLGFAILRRKDRVVSLVALGPALTIFAVMVYSDTLQWNYLADGQYGIESYLWTMQDVFSIFAVCYLPLLLFVVKGFRRDYLLDPMLGWLLLGSLSVIVSPWLAVPGYQRWLMLLVFPFSVYAVKGFEHFRLFDKGSFRKLVAVLLIFIMIGGGYSTGAFSYVVLPNTWVPTNLVQSSVGWNQIDGVIGCLRWLDNYATINSSILAEERFYGWTLIYFGRANNDVEVIFYGANSSPLHALEKALGDDFRWIYLIWYTDANFKNFQMIYSQNGISIFQYEL